MDRRDDPSAKLDEIPDLLHPVPTARLDRVRIERALDFAFASGGAESALDDCLAHAKNAVSSWDPASFERDVFLSELALRVFRITIDGKTFVPDQTHLRALLAHPPADPEIARFRQTAFRELASQPELRKNLEALYLAIGDLRTLLGAPEMGEVPQINRRRIDALVAAHAAISIMAEGFRDTRSALSRLHSFGQHVQASDAFANLTSLLDFDKNMAGVDVRLRIGHDGSLRAFEIVKIEENSANPFYQSPLRRFWQRVVRFFRGYKVREDELLEELIDRVFDPLRSEIAKLFQLSGDLEFYLAGLGFGDLARSKNLDVCIPDLVLHKAREQDAPLHQSLHQSRLFEGLFNPLLLTEGAVPCSLSFATDDAIVVLTGPNSGGKTRLLQTIAITQMLGQTGLFVPASKARLVWVDGLFVSLIEDAKADQREGRLGMELMRIRDLFERLRPGGLVMLDELCAGTNPSEGEEIFELVVSLLSELEPQAFITTHFLDFAARLERDGANHSIGKGSAKSVGTLLEFLQVELDHEQEPTYQFIPGVAKSSLAGKTAARLGVTRDELTELVERSRGAAGLSRHAATAHPATAHPATAHAATARDDDTSEESVAPSSKRSMHSGEGNAESANRRRPIGA